MGFRGFGSVNFTRYNSICELPGYGSVIADVIPLEPTLAANMNLNLVHLLALLVLATVFGCEESTPDSTVPFTSTNSNPPSIPAGHKVYAMGLTFSDALNGNVSTGDAINIIEKSNGSVLASGIPVFHTSTGSDEYELIVSVVVNDQISRAIDDAVSKDGVRLEMQ